jgi:hypothetical protein
MKQASFQIGNSLNKEKNNVSVSEYVTNVPKEVNVQKEIKNTITSHTITSHTITNNTKTHNTKTHNKPKKLVENIYYF